MNISIKPILFLLISSPLIAEVFVSHNNPVINLLQPATWFWMILTYGVPVVLIREIWKRMNLNILSVLILGVAYGILNEGIIAQSFTQISGEPAGPFIGYGTLYGIHLTWATFILTWHAINSVLMPILLTHFLFPSQAEELWLGKKGFVAAGIITALQYLFYFAGGLVPSIHSIQYFYIYLAVTVVIVILAIRIGRRFAPDLKQNKLPTFSHLILAGAVLPNLLYFLAYPATLARFPPPLISIILGWSIFIFFFQYIHSHSWSSIHLLIFSLSSSMGFSLMSAAFSKDVSLVITSIMFLIVGSWILKKSASRLTIVQ